MLEMAVSFFDIVSAVGFALAVAVALRIPSDVIAPVSRFLFVFALAIYAVVGVANVLEHADITDYFDRYEDYLEILFPLTFTYFLYSVITHQELDRRKKAEVAINAALKKAEDAKAWSDSVIEAIGDGICILTSDFRVLYQNRIHEDYMGRHLEEFCYNAFRNRDCICENCSLTLSLNDGGVHMMERTAMREDQIRDLEVTTSPLRDSGGNIIAGIEVVRDITERKKFEDQLMQIRKMEAIGQLAGGIAHDFNNILTAVTGYGSILQNEVKDHEPLRHYVDLILEASKKLKKLTLGLLTFSRKQMIHPKPVALHSIINNAVRLFPQPMGTAIDVKTELTDEALTVMADSDQIEEVLLGLAANAYEAMPDGGRLTLKTGRYEMDDAFIKQHGYGTHGSFAVITVTDSGIGMDEQTTENVFQPFFSTKETGEGTGLSLAIAYGIMKQHNGYITAESTPGKGTAFKIFLPLTDADA